MKIVYVPLSCSTSPRAVEEVSKLYRAVKSSNFLFSFPWTRFSSAIFYTSRSFLLYFGCECWKIKRVMWFFPFLYIYTSGRRIFLLVFLTNQICFYWNYILYEVARHRARWLVKLNWWAALVSLDGVLPIPVIL